jgi:hypothetical protein
MSKSKVRFASTATTPPKIAASICQSAASPNRLPGRQHKMASAHLFSLTLHLLLLHAIPMAASQLCDHNPLVNKGVNISFQASITCSKGTTPDMIDLGICQDNATYDIRLPFVFKFLDRAYNGGVFVSSNSYVTFGGSSTTATGLGPRMPAFPTLFIGGRDNAIRKLSVGPDPKGWRVRYEGWSLVSLVNIHLCDPKFEATIVWELLFLYDGSMELCTSRTQNADLGISAISDVISGDFVQKFALKPSTLFTIHTGLKACLCDNNNLLNQGLKITSQSSTSCLKGRTPDMIDVRTCRRAGSARIGLPFPFKYFGRTYGGQKDDVYVGDSSFISFGGSDGNTYWSPMNPNFSELPSLFIGARQNVLKSLSVAPDPSGWRVRYEGWSDRNASSIPSSLFESSSCPNHLAALAPNISWELLFFFDGTMQLCTGSLMGNLDSAFDSITISDRFCSSSLCANFFQNLSAISAVTGGISGTFVHTFSLMPSTLFTISTGLRQCPTSCDSNPLINNMVNIASHASSLCLKGRTPDMINVGSCEDDTFYDIQLPFPFKFLNRTYSGNDVFIGSNSYVTFGLGSTALSMPSMPALLIGSRNNSMRTLSVGPDPLGWRVRFEGWTSYLSVYRTIDCRRPPDIVWELLFMFNSSLELCASEFMNNIDPALNPIALSAVWDGTKVVSNFTLQPVTSYTIHTGLPPCALHLTLFPATAGSTGSTLTAFFPLGVDLGNHDSVTLTASLQGSGFCCSPNTPVTLVILPPSSRARGSASILNCVSAAPLLVLSLEGLSNSRLISLEVSSVKTPLLPQSSRRNITFSVMDPNQKIIFSSASGSLVEILQPILIDKDQPQLQLINNAIRSTTTINITFTPTLMTIPATLGPKVLVITLAGLGWSLSGTGQGRIVQPQLGQFGAATITADAAPDAILRVTFSGVGDISRSSPLQVLIFDVTTGDVAQPSFFNIRSAILNSDDSVIASGTSGVLDAVRASTMGVSLPSVTVSPCLVSATSVRVDVFLNPNPQYLQQILLPARIIISLTGSGFSCTNSAVTFLSPGIDACGTASIVAVARASVLAVNVTSGTFLAGLPIWFHLANCSNPHLVQPPSSDVSAAMIDANGRIVAASTSGTLSGIVDDMGPLSMLLRDDILTVSFVSRSLVPARSFLSISLIGVGIAAKETSSMTLIQPGNGLSGTATITGSPHESVLTAVFSTQISAGVAVSFSISSLYGDASTDIRNLPAALCAASGLVMAATASASYSAVTAKPAVTVKSLISSAANGLVIIPEGTYAGKSNCNNTIDDKVPARPSGAAVEMKGVAGRTIIDCSGTGMRCLIVRGSSINIKDIIFKGGSSPSFISASAVRAVQFLFDAENPTFRQRNHNRSKSASFLNKNSKLNDHQNAKSQATAENSHKKPRTGLKMKQALSFKGRGLPSFQQPHTIRSCCRLPHEAAGAIKMRMGRNSQLQSIPSDSPVFSMFRVRDEGAGGCILVLAPQHSVSLSGVSLLNCNAMYGGGGFFNVSSFVAEEGKAMSNVARQGGGLFVAATHRTDIELFAFLKNTVVTSSVSQWGLTNKISSLFRMFIVSPDAAAAAGGGAWILILSKMRNCSFEDNLAMGASVSISTVGFPKSGAHALGSGMYVLQTSQNSEMSELLFVRSSVHCAGADCIAGGNMFLASTGFKTSILGIIFIDCQAASIGEMRATPDNEAFGACITITDSSAGSLRLDGLNSFNCSALSAGRIMGGCLSFPQNVNNAVITRIFVTFFIVILSSISNIINGFGGVAAFAFVNSTDISAFFVASSSITTASTINPPLGTATTLGNFAGTMIYAMNVINASFSSISATNLSHSGFNTRLFGGMMSFIEIDEKSHVSNISFRNSSFVFESIRQYGGFNGACLSIGRNANIPGTLKIRQILIENVNIKCAGIDCIASSFFWLAFNPRLSSAKPDSYVMKEIAVRNSSILCTGERCSCWAAIYVETEMVLSAFKRLSQPMSLNFSDASFENFYVSCHGVKCQVKGACMAFSLRDGAIRNVSLRNVTSSSNGTASFVSGSIFLLNNNPMKTLLISNLTSDNTAVHAHGTFSSAIGGIFVGLHGNVSFENNRISNAHVSCVGNKCQSAGGAFAFISSLGPSNKRSNAVFSASVLHSKISGSVVECSGEKCCAAGGAIFAGEAYRGPIEQNTGFIGQPNISFSRDILPLMIRVENCTISSNLLRSMSVGASLSGAGMLIRFARAQLANMTLIQNTIQSSSLSAFVSGGGIYVTGSDTSAEIESSQVAFNSAGVFGSGGAIFVGQFAALVCISTLLGNSSAKQGGGLFVDGSSVSLTNVSIFNNSAHDKGGGLFCVVLSSLNTTSSLVLSNVSVFDNFVLNSNAAAVGAAVYILGDVHLELLNGSHVSMSGSTRYTTLEAIVSLSRPAQIDKSTQASCKGGSVVSIAQIQVEIDEIKLVGPSDEVQHETQCSPACQYEPQIQPYRASGFLASCVPCPRGTYSFFPSSNSNDTISSHCRPCPFGAKCSGGNLVQTLDSYWGWKESETMLASEFLHVPEGYGCEGSDCETIDSCGRNHSDVLCGGCVENFSAAFFTTDCVSDSDCVSWKIWLLICGALFYCFIFSCFLRYEAEPVKSGNVSVTQSSPAPSPALAKSENHTDNKFRSSAFQVLMWYYQLTGLLLMMPNPLKFVDTNAMLLNVIGVVFGSVPVSQAFNLPSFVLCTRAGSAPADIILANMLLYLLWAFVMVLLTFKRVWLPVFNWVYSMLNFAPEFWEHFESNSEAMSALGNAGKIFAFFLALKWALVGLTFATFVLFIRRIIAFPFVKVRSAVMWLLNVISCKKFGANTQPTSLQETTLKKVAYPAEIRGKAWLDFGIAAYSALLSLLVQCTTCINIKGLKIDGQLSVELRWFYDGRVACFSDSGTLPGLWQIAALIGVILLSLLPLMLALYMRRTLSKNAVSYNLFEVSALPAYLGQFNSSNKHWFTIM